MKVNALLMDEQDNVVTCVKEIAAGQTVVYQKGGQLCTLTAAQDIPYCHKVALEPLAEGANVIKYGELIGRTLSPIQKGGWVCHENIYSVPRDYDSELVEEDDQPLPTLVPTKTELSISPAKVQVPVWMDGLE